jgi:hypothetical protein
VAAHRRVVVRLGPPDLAGLDSQGVEEQPALAVLEVTLGRGAEQQQPAAGGQVLDQAALDRRVEVTTAGQGDQ